MNEPLVLLPGMMCDAGLFLPQIAALSAERAVHIAPTTQGETVAEIAANVLETAPAKFALAGHGLGAIVAMEVQRCAPDRVTRLALMSTNSQPETPHAAAGREANIVRAKAGRLSDVIRNEMRAEYLFDGPVRDDVLQFYMDMALDLGADVFVRQSRVMQKRPDQQKTLRKLRVPALVLCGVHDDLTPVLRHEFMSTLIPYATLAIVPDAGHLPSLEQPSETTRHLREWLEQPLVLR